MDFSYLDKLKDKDWYGTKSASPPPPDLLQALQALQLQMQGEGFNQRISGQLPLPVPGLSLQGAVSPPMTQQQMIQPIDWRLMLKLQRGF